MNETPEGKSDSGAGDLGSLFPPQIIELLMIAGYEVRNHGYGEITIICYNGRWVQVDTTKHSRPPKAV